MEKRLVLAVAALAAALPVHADCRWEWLCSGDGACKQMPVCDTVFDVAPPRPESAPPTPPPLAMRPHKIPSPMGTLSCEPVMRQSASGHWSWAEACFCSDEMKAPDPTRPFANIVRCETPWKKPSAAQPQPAPGVRSPA